MAVKVASREEVIQVGDVPVTVRRGGDGPPLLMFHDELGFPGWMSWNDDLASRYELIIPMQPAYGQTPKVEWVRSYNSQPTATVSICWPNDATSRASR